MAAITASRSSFARARDAWRVAPAALSRAAGAALAAVLLGTVAPGGPARAADNPVVVENRNPGNPASEWDVGAGSTAIQGFTTNISYNLGDTVAFKVKTSAASYRLDIYRAGYYGGMGARKVGSVTGAVVAQPACLTAASVGLVDCGNWAVTATWSIPPTAVSGVYFAKLVAKSGAASHAFFVVRDDGSRSDLVVQTPDTTWQAYNAYGGNSLYTGSPDGRAYKLSYNRPFLWRSGGSYSGINSFFSAAYPMVRWLEANGYDASYISGVDTDNIGALIRNHKVFVSMGHDEYWSKGQRASVEAARDAGVNLAFFSGNEVYWKTRWENSIDSSHTPYRTFPLTYKETWANQPIDPLDPPTWTGTWRDPRFSPPGDGGRPENALTGTIFAVDGPQYNDLQVPGDYGRMRLWRNTDLATMDTRSTATLGTSVLGYEWDVDADNGARPRGPGPVQLEHLGRPPAPARLRQQRGAGDGDPQPHALQGPERGAGVRRRHDAVVVGPRRPPRQQRGRAGGPARPPHPAGDGEPARRHGRAAGDAAGAARAGHRLDRPHAAHLAGRPRPGRDGPAGSTVLISGTAADAGGGVVGGVEVSVDGGATWHPATGRESWSFAWAPRALGTVTIRSAAVDDSGNLEARAARPP